MRSPQARIGTCFVDSVLQFGYPKVLARCCAWGLCAPLDPSGQSFRLRVPSSDKVLGTGRRLPDMEWFDRSEQAKALRGQSPHPHANRIVWQWVELKPLRFARAATSFARPKTLRPFLGLQLCTRQKR